MDEVVFTITPVDKKPIRKKGGSSKKDLGSRPPCPRCGEKENVRSAGKDWHCLSCGRYYRKSGSYNKPWKPWKPEEDQIIIDNPDKAAKELIKYLDRSKVAIDARRHKFICEGKIEPRKCLPAIQNPQCPFCKSSSVGIKRTSCQWKCVDCKKRWSMTQEEREKEETGVPLVCSNCGKEYLGPDYDWEGHYCQECMDKYGVGMYWKFNGISKPELVIASLLEPFGFIHCETMRNGKKYYCPDCRSEGLGIIVEYDGRGGHMVIPGWKERETQEEIDEKDERRNQFYRDGGYRVIIIHYTEWDDPDDINGLKTILSRKFVEIGEETPFSWF